MKLNIEIPFKALSQNNIERSSKKTNRRYKTEKAKLFNEAISTVVTNHVDFKSFVGHFNPNIHAIKATFIFKFCHTKMFTKKNKGYRRLSNRVGDVTNYLKWTEDCIFRCLGIDDRFVSESHIYKHPSLGQDSILALLEIVPLNCIEEFSDYLTK